MKYYCEMIKYGQDTIDDISMLLWKHTDVAFGDLKSETLSRYQKGQMLRMSDGPYFIKRKINEAFRAWDVNVRVI